jgi:hypothetical protein
MSLISSARRSDVSIRVLRPQLRLRRRGAFHSFALIMRLFFEGSHLQVGAGGMGVRQARVANWPAMPCDTEC